MENNVSLTEFYSDVKQACDEIFKQAYEALEAKGRIIKTMTEANAIEVAFLSGKVDGLHQAIWQLLPVLMKHTNTK